MWGKSTMSTMTNTMTNTMTAHSRGSNVPLAANFNDLKGRKTYSLRQMNSLMSIRT